MDVSSRDNLDLGKIKRKNNLRELQPVDSRSSVQWGLFWAVSRRIEVMNKVLIMRGNVLIHA